jgi:transcriptional regulator with XRE-family HTH domain
MRCIGLSFRVLRRRHGLTQAQVAARCGISQQSISRLEREHLDGANIPTIRRILAVLDATLLLDVRYQGEAVARLVDADHAWLQNWLAAHLTDSGWQVRVELSFNHFGDRGRYDVIAFHPAARVLVVVEIKTEIRDAQDTLGRLDVKVRLARQAVAELGWQPNTIVPALIIADGRTAQRRVAEHAALFGRLNVRGRQAIGWLRHPSRPATGGLLAFVRVPLTRSASTRRAA